MKSGLAALAIATIEIKEEKANIKYQRYIEIHGNGW